MAMSPRRFSDYRVASAQSLASVREGTTRYGDYPNPIPPGYWVTAGPLVRAIPVAVAAEPGIKEPALPEMRFRTPGTAFV